MTNPYICTISYWLLGRDSNYRRVGGWLQSSSRADK